MSKVVNRAIATTRHDFAYLIGRSADPEVVSETLREYLGMLGFDSFVYAPLYGDGGIDAASARHGHMPAMGMNGDRGWPDQYLHGGWSASDAMVRHVTDHAGAVAWS